MGQDQDDIASLMRWRAAETSFAESNQRLRDDPRFGIAARALAANMLDAAAQDEELDGIFKDAGRYVAAMWAITAHLTDGLTLPRLKDVCAASGWLGPGRARALLIYLRYLGYFETVSAGARNAPARYAPTAKFKAAWRRHLALALEAAHLIEPAVSHVLARLDENDVFETLTRLQGEELLASTQAFDKKSDYVTIFMNRYAGLQIVMLLLTGSTGAFPPSDPIPFSISAAAKRFKVSRVHITRMLADGEQAGLIRRNDDATITLQEAGRAAIAGNYALQLIRLLSQAARTLEVGQAVQAPALDHA